MTDDENVEPTVTRVDFAIARIAEQEHLSGVVDLYEDAREDGLTSNRLIYAAAKQRFDHIVFTNWHRLFELSKDEA